MDVSTSTPYRYCSSCERPVSFIHAVLATLARVRASEARGGGRPSLSSLPSLPPSPGTLIINYAAITIMTVDLKRIFDKYCN